jgi:hypothetical protein
MKKRMFTMAICASVLLAACSKDESITAEVENNTAALKTASGTKAGSYASGWETVSSWTKTDSSGYQVFTANRAVPEITADVQSGGAVLVWARNIPDYDGSILTKPMRLPFAIYPQPGRPAWHEQYYFGTATGSVRLQYRTNKHQYVSVNVMPPTGVQFRFIAVSAQELGKMGLTPGSLQGMDYEQMIGQLGIPQ